MVDLTALIANIIVTVSEALESQKVKFRNFF